VVPADVGVHNVAGVSAVASVPAVAVVSNAAGVSAVARFIGLFYQTLDADMVIGNVNLYL